MRPYGTKRKETPGCKHGCCTCGQPPIVNTKGGFKVPNEVKRKLKHRARQEGKSIIEETGD